MPRQRSRRQETQSAYSFVAGRRVIAVRHSGSSRERYYLATCKVTGRMASFIVRSSDRQPNVGSMAGRYGRATSWITELDAWANTRLMEGGNIRVTLSSIRAAGRTDGGRPTLGRVLMPLLTRRRTRWPLYHYQRTGVKRLIASRRCLLADDMGLGKTLQVIVAVARLLEHEDCRRILVVAPASVLDTWHKEFQRWAPMICVRVADSNRATMVFRECWNVAHVVLTNYEQMRIPPDPVIRRAPQILVLDEAHRVKNWNAQVSSGIRSLDLRRVWALTGTPLEKGKTDLVGLMTLLEPQRFGRQDDDLPSWLLRAKTRPYTLRREKADVLVDLPEVTYRTERIQLRGEHAHAYQRAQKVGASAEDMLAAFRKLQTLSDYDPSTGASAKLDRAIEILTTICSDIGQKAVVFSYLIRPLELLKDRLLTTTDVSFAGVYQGNLTTSERTMMLKRFRELRSGVLLASLRAAGEGLTLTEANHVLLINRWWNPSANAQAIDRVHRIGQQLPVTVYYFEAVGTVDEHLTEVLEGKEELFEEVVARLAVSRDFVLGEERSECGKNA